MGFAEKKGEERLQGQKIAKIIFANKTENTEQWTIQIIFIWKSRLLNNLQISPSYPLQTCMQKLQGILACLFHRQNHHMLSTDVILNPMRLLNDFQYKTCFIGSGSASVFPSQVI